MRPRTVSARIEPKSNRSRTADRAFVVQLSAASDLRRRRLSGRIEHVVSGTSAHFRSLEQLLGFIRRLVRDAT